MSTNSVTGPTPQNPVPGAPRPSPAAPPPPPAPGTAASPPAPPAQDTLQLDNPGQPAAPASRHDPNATNEHEFDQLLAAGDLAEEKAAFGRELEKFQKDHQGRSAAQALSEDPGLRKLAAGIASKMDQAIAGGDMTAAMQAQQDLVDKLPPGENTDNFKQAFSAVRAENARQEGAPPLGVNNPINPKWDGNVAHPSGDTEIKQAGADAKARFQERIDKQMQNGINDVRLEIDPNALPDPEVAAAYDKWKVEALKGDAKPKFADFLAAANDPTSATGKGLSAEARKKLQEPDAVQRLTYQEVTEAQLAVVKAEAPKLTANVGTADLVDFDRLPKPVNPADPELQTSIKKAGMLAAWAQQAGAKSLEIGNEPNGQAPKALDPDTAAYVFGAIYQEAKKATHNDPNFKVNMAAMSFDNVPHAAPEVEALANDPDLDDAKVRAAMPGASDEQVRAFRDAAANYRAGDPKRENDKSKGEAGKRAMLAIYDQVTGKASHGDADATLAYLDTMIAAQKRYFGSSGLMTDQTNVHLYGSAQDNEAFVKGLKERLDRHELPPEAVITEAGSQDPNRKKQAADLATQYANAAALLRANGFDLKRYQAFKMYDDDNGRWDIGGNPDLMDLAKKIGK